MGREAIPNSAALEESYGECDDVGPLRARPHSALRVHEPSLLDEVLQKLKDIERRTGIERTLAIGELILNRFFGGDPRVWRDRRRNKNNSIRRLAERADCPFCRSALNEAVGVYVAVLTLPGIRTFGNVSASHVAAVLKLELAERREMLEKAEREAWSVRELRTNVVALRREAGERRGRPASAPESRALGVLRKNVRLLDDAVVQVGAVQRWSSEASSALDDIARDLALLSGRVALLATRRERVAASASGSLPAAVPRGTSSRAETAPHEPLDTPEASA